MQKFRPILRSSYLCRSCARLVVGRNQPRFASTAAKAPEIYDVVCVGGGPAGLSLMTALRASKVTSNLKIALVEGQDLAKSRNWHPPQDEYSNRASSFTPASRDHLEEIGAWDHVKHERVQPYHEAQVWDGVSGARMSLDWATATTTTIGQPLTGSRTVAYMIENLNIVYGLLHRLDQLGGATLLDKTRVSSISLGSEDTDSPLDLSTYPILTLSDGTTIAARLLVGADGPNSPVRHFANIPSRGWPYNRHGVVATLTLESSGWGGSTHKTAYQRFLPTGPIALLPFPGLHASLVWSTLPSHAAFLKSLPSESFTALVNAAFRLSPTDLSYLHTLPPSADLINEVIWRSEQTPVSETLIPQLVTSVQPSSVASFPLRLSHADSYHFQRITLVGDAAHTTHPLAGQGLNQGQADAKALAETIEYAVSHGMDIGSLLTLEKYTAARWATNHAFLGAVDKIHKIYSWGSGPLVTARSWGLSAVENVPALKGFFMGKAEGRG
ncbi:MAG: putative ubiquinone biosynthesis monooxygenase [Cirrosporium novae-zelandiae]|nr:MAG: putative ubiquinone biosynthesis monooxygenase [Cirrosporium novae-zelandiae]